MSMKALCPTQLACIEVPSMPLEALWVPGDATAATYH